MIVVTGAAGFISSCLVSELNKQNETKIIVVDDFSKHEKDHNLQSKTYLEKVERNDFFTWFQNNKSNVTFVFHLGARTDTTEQSIAIFDALNLNFSKKVWQLCAENSIPLIYASSAATYGNGEFGYDDNHDIVNKLADCIELLEDIVNPHYSYQISANYKDNDWNDPLNDHWDNY